LLILLVGAAFSVEDWREPNSDPAALTIDDSKHTTQIAHAVIGERVDQLEQKNESLKGGMSGYLLPFEIVSVHLLVVLIGAAYLARAKKRVANRGDSSSMEPPSP